MLIRRFHGMPLPIGDKLIHGYFGIKWMVVWSVIKYDIPYLDIKIRRIIKNIKIE
jgi:uncharacterized protein with HEPN domain